MQYLLTFPSKQRGLALITAMLVVAIAATTAAYLSFDQQIWLRQSQNLTDRAQAEVVRAGAQEWAITILAKDAKDSQSDDLTEDWARKLPPSPRCSRSPPGGRQGLDPPKRPATRRTE